MDIRNTHLSPMSSKEWIQIISNNSFTSEELCWIYCCGLGCGSLLTDPENLPAITKVILDKGMDPNQLVADDWKAEEREITYYQTPMISVTRFENDVAAVKSLKLLLEAGGNPNTVYYFDEPGENVFEFYIEDEFVHAPDLDGGSFYGLLLCWVYGGKQQSGYKPFKMLIDAPKSVFKDYNRYWYEYEKHSSTMYIIEKETGRRVAQYH